jgi:hypothetical protein
VFRATKAPFGGHFGDLSAHSRHVICNCRVALNDLITDTVHNGFVHIEEVLKKELLGIENFGERLQRLERDLAACLSLEHMQRESVSSWLEAVPQCQAHRAVLLQQLIEPLLPSLCARVSEQVPQLLISHLNETVCPVWLSMQAHGREASGSSSSSSEEDKKDRSAGNDEDAERTRCCDALRQECGDESACEKHTGLHCSGNCGRWFHAQCVGCSMLVDEEGSPILEADHCEGLGIPLNGDDGSSEDHHPWCCIKCWEELKQDLGPPVQFDSLRCRPKTNDIGRLCLLEAPRHFSKKPTYLTTKK